MGLTSIQNRVKFIGATLKIDCIPHQGVTIAITVPYLQKSEVKMALNTII
jgi:signal transduction histidine kinase